MQENQLVLAKSRFYSSVTILYIATLLFIWYALNPIAHYNHLTLPPADNSWVNAPIAPKSTTKKITVGRPVRIVIPSVGIDLPVDEGFYNSADNSWSLSGTHAQFAMPTSLANDDSGNTFLYGHNNKHVFGPLPKISLGDTALIYTDTNHIFTYTFMGAQNMKPEDTTVLEYKGPPIMTIQTCSGSLNEWRRMFTFKFDKVEQGS